MTKESDNYAEALVACMQALCELGLNTGRSGNASLRIDDGRFAITPSGVHPRELKANQIVELVLKDNSVPADKNPSSEWRVHRDIFVAYSDVQAIVHAHSNAATALACMRQEIPAFHYMVAVAGGDSIECAPYATFGSEALSEHAVAALRDRRACLLANHGLIATGTSLLEARDLAEEVEQLSFQYLLCLNAGNPAILTKDEMNEVLDKFKDYGKRTG